MPRTGIAGIALALCLFAGSNAARLEASKVSMEAPAASASLQPEQTRPAEDVTASKPQRAVTEPVVRPSGRAPVQYDALPEHDRKAHTLDEILGQVAEV